MEAMRWEQPAEAAQARAGLLLQGLERRRRVGHHGARVRGVALGRRALRRDRPGGVLRLPGDAADRAADRGRHPRDRVARARAVERAPGRGQARRRVPDRAPSRTCAGGPSRRPSSTSRASWAWTWSCRWARCSPTCRTRGPVQITGIAADAALSERLGLHRDPLRGTDRHRRRAAGRVRRKAGHAGREPLGAGAPLRRDGSEPEGDARAARAARRTCSRCTIDMTELEEAAVEYERRLDEAVASEPEVEALVERLERQMDDEEISFRNLPSRRLDRARVRALPEGAGRREVSCRRLAPATCDCGCAYFSAAGQISWKSQIEQALNDGCRLELLGEDPARHLGRRVA